MKKKTTIAIISCVLICAVSVGVYFGFLAKPKELQIVYSHASYVYDVDEPREASGFADYVFVGRVEQVNEVKYDYVSTYETEKGSKTSGIPFTGYDITIIENIKGNLRVDATIPLWKQGGITMDGERIHLMEGDFLPEKGDLCVFYVAAGEDGELLANHNYKLPDLKRSIASVLSPQSAQNGLEQIENMPIYQESVEAVKNEIPFEKERFTAPTKFLEPAKTE
jgi:hypothetical protein